MEFRRTIFFYPVILLKVEIKRKESERKTEIGEILENVFYVNGAPSQVVIKFSMLYHDWCELQNKPYWEQVETFLAQSGNTDTHELRKGQKG